MRTLEEVINAIEKAHIQIARCLEWGVGFEYDDELKEDALFYLKEYQEKTDEICKLAKIMADSWELRKQTMAFEDRNDPISWDELKQMEGKPVWMERNVCDGFREWCLVHAIIDGEIWFYKIESDDIYNLVLNSKKGETFADQQKQGRRPRFSIKKSIIEAKGLQPVKKINLTE